MIRRAEAGDVPALEAFLTSHAATSMFLRGNLAAFGIDNREHPNATTYYVRETGGAIDAVMGCTNGGFLMCQAPDADAAFWASCVQVLKGHSVLGATGAPEQVDALVAALGFGAVDFRIHRLEPLYRLDLTDLRFDPAQAGELRRPQAEDAAWLTEWFDGYQRETGKGTLNGVDGAAAARAFVEKPDGRLLEIDGQVCAMSALNARTPDMVQIGGVYVPPAQRGRGYGGRIVALHLSELRRQGVAQAILFAASAVAARAYERIGFEHIGAYRITLLDDLMPVRAAP
ncbi:MAG: GNAT family N-acetyltransferase [Pseudomonadota bacterium]